MTFLTRNGRFFRLIPLLAVLALIVAACGGTTTGPSDTSAPTAATAPDTAAQATAAPAAGDAATAAPAGETGADTGSSGELMTVSFEQQATWVRNFNPFVGDNRVPTTNGIHEPLMIYNELTGELQPWLATEYAWSDDNKTLTFTVRDGVQWSDGEDFSAEDVAFTFNLFKEFPGLQGGGAALAGDDPYVDSVEIVDGNKIQLNFNRVFTPGLYDLAQQNIVPEHIWSEVEDPVKFTNDEPVGTGPFTEVQNFQNQIWELHKNPNYWQEGKPMFEGFRFPSYPGNDQANLATINGENDWAGNFIPDIEQTYVAKNPENHGYWFPALGGTIHLYLNTTRPPFDNVDVRKAISMAINREQIVTVAMYDYTHPSDATGLSDAYNNWRSEEAVTTGAEWVTLNVEQANQMLDAAGLARGGDGVRTLPDGTPMRYDINVVSGWTDWVSACQIMAQNLKEVGIEAQVKTYDFSAWFERVQKGDFDMSIGWSSGGATPFNFYRGVMASSTVRPAGETAGENWHRYSNEQADELLTQFAATSDQAEQQEIANQLQQVYAENAPAVPLFPGPQWYEYNTTRFEGFPNAENPYVHGSPFRGTNQLLIMTTVTPK